MLYNTLVVSRGKYFLQYHMYLIPGEVWLKETLAFAYGNSLSKGPGLEQKGKVRIALL